MGFYFAFKFVLIVLHNIITISDFDTYFYFFFLYSTYYNRISSPAKNQDMPTQKAKNRFQ